VSFHGQVQQLRELPLRAVEAGDCVYVSTQPIAVWVRARSGSAAQALVDSSTAAAAADASAQQQQLWALAECTVGASVEPAEARRPATDGFPLCSIRVSAAGRLCVPVAASRRWLVTPDYLKLVLAMAAGQLERQREGARALAAVLRRRLPERSAALLRRIYRHPAATDSDRSFVDAYSRGCGGSAGASSSSRSRSRSPAAGTAAVHGEAADDAVLQPPQGPGQDVRASMRGGTSMGGVCASAAVDLAAAGLESLPDPAAVT
jgi:hypothetical protein